MMKLFIQILILATLLLCAGCATYCGYEGAYKGKVIDSETKQPLAGVVVLGIWYKVYPNVAGTSSDFYDSVELLTDKNGEFKIPGQGLLLFTFLEKMGIVVIYKAGYEMLEYGPWSSLKTLTARKNVQWDGDKAIISLRKMSYEERKKNIPSRPGIEQKRQQLLTDEINKERIEFGYRPL